jgi:hypothetical protein
VDALEAPQERQHASEPQSTSVCSGRRCVLLKNLFMVHAMEDNETARPIARALHQLGFEVWYFGKPIPTVVNFITTPLSHLE